MHYFYKLFNAEEVGPGTPERTIHKNREVILCSVTTETKKPEYFMKMSYKT
jgi:hypothetical protein